MSDVLAVESVPLLDVNSRVPLSTKSIGSINYIRIAWPDYLSIALVAALMAGIHSTPVYYYQKRGVPLWPSGIVGNSTDSVHNLRAPMDLDHPWEKEPLSSLECGLVVVLVPLLMIGLFQFRTRNLWDFHAGMVGVLKAVVATTFVCVILKQFIGGFRPYYMEACKPNMSMVYKEPYHDRYWFDATACTGSVHDVAKALQTFPSGHTANSFAAATFLALYLNAKLKVFADYASQFWAFIVAVAPLIGASLISGSMYISHQHHAYDIVWGMIIGFSLGILAYRSSYSAVLDFRYNHIPLPPFATHTRLSYALDAPYVVAGQLTDVDKAEDNHLDVWSWWKRSGASGSDKKEEISQLRRMRNVGTTVKEMEPILKLPRDNGSSEAIEISLG